MGDYTPRLAKLAQHELQPGETFLAGAKAMSRGGSRPPDDPSLTDSQILSGSVSQRLADEAAFGESGTFEAPTREAPNPVAVGLTDRRLMVWKRGGFTGRPKEIIGRIPLDRITAIEEESSSPELASRATSRAMRVRLSAGGSIDFDVPPGCGRHDVVQAFERLRRRH